MRYLIFIIVCTIAFAASEVPTYFDPTTGITKRFTGSDTTLVGSLNSSGTITSQGLMTASSGVSVTGNATINGSATVSGQTTINGDQSGQTRALTVSGRVSLTRSDIASTTSLHIYSDVSRHNTSETVSNYAALERVIDTLDVRIENPSSRSLTGIDFFNAVDGVSVLTFSNPVTSGHGLFLYDHADKHYALLDEAFGTAFIFQQGGRMGISEESPQSILEISSSGAVSESLFAISRSDGEGSHGDLFFVDRNGNVGIGENSPKNKLEVGGAISATRIYVEGSTNVTAPNSGITTSVVVEDGTSEGVSGVELINASDGVGAIAFSSVDGTASFLYSHTDQAYYYLEKSGAPIAAFSSGGIRYFGGASFDLPVNMDSSLGVTGTITASSLEASGYITATDMRITGSTTISPTGGITSNPPYIISTTIIMKSPDGSCSACGPNNSDVWSCSSVACP